MPTSTVVYYYCRVFTDMILQRVFPDSQCGEPRVEMLKVIPLLLPIQSLGKGLLLVLSFLLCILLWFFIFLSWGSTFPGF